MANKYELQIKDTIKEEGKITRVDYKYIAHNESNQMAFVKGSKNITEKDKLEDLSLEEWLLKKIKTKEQKKLKGLLGQKTNASK
tara:strand:+ start:1541 stop:1792 length:252 start_codon:yes stop_codon:yes gene_type:complete